MHHIIAVGAAITNSTSLQTDSDCGPKKRSAKNGTDYYNSQRKQTVGKHPENAREFTLEYNDLYNSHKHISLQNTKN